jgi:NADH:ubiquinone reductase (H+-translocating)
MASTRPKVVIVGGGFAGLNAAKKLAHSPVDVTLLDRKNHHLFQPLLYQVATAGLSPAEIAVPIRRVLEKKQNVQVLLGEVTSFDLPNHRVLLDHVSMDFDYLIVATGATHSYFGHDDWAQNAPGLKTIENALEIRRRILLAFEIAERQAYCSGTHPQLNFVVIGGGPTGVELAGTLSEITRHALAEDFRLVDPRRTRILLVEAGPRLLAAYPEDLSRSAAEQLQKLGVEVRTGTPVTEVAPDQVRIGEHEIVPAAVILWGAGVRASSLGRKLGAPVDKAGRVIVNNDCSLPDYPNVFVVGDLASMKMDNGKPVPGVAPAAIQQGKYVAEMIANDLKGRPRKPFHYLDKGSLATIGRAAAVADFGKIHLSGFIAWLGWLFIHIFFLIGFRNRLIVLFDWAYSYFTMERSARLITGSTELPSAMAQNQALAAASQETSEDKDVPRSVA